MSEEKSYANLENQFGESMATVSSLYNLMWGVGDSDEFDPKMIQEIGRGGFAAAKNAEKAFNELLDLYLSERREVKNTMNLVGTK